jgi:hypothetical protein
VNVKYEGEREEEKEKKTSLLLSQLKGIALCQLRKKRQKDYA